MPTLSEPKGKIYFFTSENCRPCLPIKAALIHDESLWSKHYELITVDVGTEAGWKMAQDWGVTSTPTLVAVDSKGGYPGQRLVGNRGWGRFLTDVRSLAE